jgi:glucose/arabinose dehydrogenase
VAELGKLEIFEDGETTQAVAEIDLPSSVDLGLPFNVWIDYNGSSNQLAVYISNDADKPFTPLLISGHDLHAIVGNQAYLGFTGSTADEPTSHQVLTWTFSTAVPVIPLTSADMTEVTVVSGLQSPTAVAWLGSGQLMLIAQKNGIVRVAEDGTLLSIPFINLSSIVNDIADRGLIGIAAHPDFENFPYVYLSYTYDPPEVTNYTGLAGPDGGGNRAARLMRVTADASTGYTTVIPGSELVILGTSSTWNNFNAFVDSTIDINEPSAGYNPDGSNIRDFVTSDSHSHTIGSVTFGPDGALYVSTGDGASYNQVDPRAVRVQDIDNLSGKILRIDPLTGEGLSDNPFYDGDPDSNRSKVYQLGLRNPFRFSVDSLTGGVYVGDVGWSNWEEINRGVAGANFGWPFYEGGSGSNSINTAYANIPGGEEFFNSNPLITPSLYALSHANDGAVAVIAGDVYRGGAYSAEYYGDLLINDIGVGVVSHISFEPDGSVAAVDVFASGAFGVVQLITGPDGLVYFVDLDDGRVGRWEMVCEVRVSSAVPK